MAAEPPFSINSAATASPGRSANVSERLAQLTSREQDVSAAWGAGSRSGGVGSSVAATPSRAPVFVTPARMPPPAMPPSASSRAGGLLSDAQLGGGGSLDLSFSLDVGGGAPGGALPAFSQDFVKSLQAQHQQRLNDSLASSAELLRSKDRELESLHQRNMQLLHAGAAAQEEAQAKIDSLVKEQREIIADVQQLAAKHEQERAAIQAHHECVLQQLSSAFQDQLSQAVLRASQEAEAAAAAARAHHASVEAHLTQQMREQQALYQQQLQQQQQDMRRAMQLENERAASAQEESTSQIMSLRKECADLKSQLESCDRELQQLRETDSLEARRRAEFRQQQQLLQEQHRVQQQEMQQRTTAAESAAASLGSEVVALRAQLLEQERTFAAARSNAEREAASLTQSLAAVRSQCEVDITALQRTLESGQTFSQRQLEQNRELVEIVRALQTEREGLLGELSDALQRMQMLESERARLSEELVEVKRELTRMDKVVYGKSRPLTNGGEARKLQPPDTDEL